MTKRSIDSLLDVARDVRYSPEFLGNLVRTNLPKLERALTGKPSSEQIIIAADEALRRAGAPICYLHRSGAEGMFALVIEVEHWRKITDMIPEGNEITELIMNHGHIEGDDDQ